MSEDNKDFDKFLDKKEQEGGAFENKDAKTTSEKDSKDVDPIEETINKA